MLYYMLRRTNFYARSRFCKGRVFWGSLASKSWTDNQSHDQEWLRLRGFQFDKIFWWNVNYEFMAEMFRKMLKYKVNQIIAVRAFVVVIISFRINHAFLKYSPILNCQIRCLIQQKSVFSGTKHDVPHLSCSITAAALYCLKPHC